MKINSMKSFRLQTVLLFILIGTLTPPLAAQENGAVTEMEFIVLSSDGTHFVYRNSGERFRPWGFNYDHDHAGRLIEDYWDDEWEKVEEDFLEMRALGANVVRIHLQLGKFMRSATEADGQALKKLSDLLKLAERTGLYLDLTGLGTYHRDEVPAWYSEMDEQDRWETQAAFWRAVAGVCANSPAVFCYDLMNEPLWPSSKKETDWLAGELAGKFFCQRLTLDLGGRDPFDVARQWVDQLTEAIRSEDDRHLITLGAIPWALTFPKAKPQFYSERVSENLDFVSVHFYPESGKVEQAVEALKVYDLGKPLVIEEMFPLRCSVEELDSFIDATREVADGYIGFYWGATVEDYKKEGGMAGALISGWINYFRKKTPEFLK